MENFYSPLRQYKRKKIQGRAAVFKGATFYFETVVEIGQGGMMLRAKKSYEKSQCIEISLILPNDGFVSSMCEVLYSFETPEGRFYGLRFLDLSQEAKLAIRSYTT